MGHLIVAILIGIIAAAISLVLGASVLRALVIYVVAGSQSPGHPLLLSTRYIASEAFFIRNSVTNVASFSFRPARGNIDGVMPFHWF